MIFIPGEAECSKPGFYHLINSMLRLFFTIFYKQQKRRILVAIAAGFIHNICTVLLLLSIGKYIEIAFNGNGSKSRALQWVGIHLPNNLTLFFVFFFGVTFLKFAVAWIEKYFTKNASLLYTEELRRLYFSHLLSNKDLFATRRFSKWLVWFSSDLKTLQRLAEKATIGFIKDGLFLMLCMYLLLRLSPLFAIILTVITVSGWFINRFYQKGFSTHLKNSRNAGAGITAHISKTFAAAEKNFEQVDAAKQTDKLTELQQQMIYKKQEHLLRTSAGGAAIPLFMYVLLGIVMLVAVSSSAVELSAADVLTFLLLLLTLFGPMGRIIRMPATVNEGKQSLSRLDFLKNTELLNKITAK
jgi:ABC-type multidrug transport system fused ATPase/permease subunit